MDDRSSTVQVCLQFYYGSINQLLRGEIIGIDVNLSIFDRILEAEKLLSVFVSRPIERFSHDGVFIGDFKIDQNVGICDPAPHRRDVRVLLRNMPAIKTKRGQASVECGFSRSTNADDPDQRFGPDIFHNEEMNEGAPRSIRDLVLVVIHRNHWQAYGHAPYLISFVRSGP